MKTKFKEERDEELDRAVERLEQEVTKGRKEVEQEYQERIRYVIYFISQILSYEYFCIKDISIIMYRAIRYYIGD